MHSLCIAERKLDLWCVPQHALTVHHAGARSGGAMPSMPDRTRVDELLKQHAAM